MRFRMPALTALLTAGILVLTGCVPPPDVVLPVEPSGAQPVFASDEEALAAAVAAYEEYARVSDEIGHDGGEGADRLAGLVTDDWLSIELDASNGRVERGTTTQGFSLLTNAQLQQYWEEPRGTAFVSAYFCVDVSSTRVFNANGDDVTPEDRADEFPVEAALVSATPDSQVLLISEVSVWPGSGVC